MNALTPPVRREVVLIAMKWSSDGNGFVGDGLAFVLRNGVGSVTDGASDETDSGDEETGGDVSAHPHAESCSCEVANVTTLPLTGSHLALHHTDDASPREVEVRRYVVRRELSGVC
jgi:hypothetical protein